jgi:hypothetical protein
MECGDSMLAIESFTFVAEETGNRLTMKMLDKMETQIMVKKLIFLNKEEKHFYLKKNP